MHCIGTRVLLVIFGGSRIVHHLLPLLALFLKPIQPLALNLFTTNPSNSVKLGNLTLLSTVFCYTMRFSVLVILSCSHTRFRRLCFMHSRVQPSLHAKCFGCYCDLVYGSRESSHAVTATILVLCLLRPFIKTRGQGHNPATLSPQLSSPVIATHG